MLNQRILLSESSRKSGVVVMTFESGLQQDLHSLLKRIISFKHNSIPPSFLEIEQLQEEISEIQIRHENRVASINTEKHLLSSVYQHVWKKFDSTVFPFYKVDEPLSEIFESLIEIRNELDKLDDTGFTREKLDHLEQIEKQQTEIESLFTNGFTCNDGSEMVVSESQMILSTLLHRNISRINSFRNRLPSSNEFLGSVEAKLENLIHNLQAIKASYLFENLESTFKLEELQSILEQVLEIETMKKMHDFENGSEYDRHWYAEDLLDTAHDLIQSCLVQVKTTAEDEDFGQAFDNASISIIEVAKKANTQIIGHVIDALETAKLAALSTIYSIQSSLEPGLEVIKNAIPNEITTSAERILASISQTAYSGVVKFLGRYEPVDSTLFCILNSLINIRDELVCLRNEKLFMRLNADEKDKIWTRVYDVRLQEMIEKLGDIHDERIKNGGFKNGDGLFPRGQDVLKALTSQCYCLVLETL